MPDPDTAPIDISFVVIGYNEAAGLTACLEAISEADLSGLAWEVIYVDGGSTDGSLDLARAAGVDACLGGERRRRAAENRNLGFQAARGRFVQFLDGDMRLDPAWPKAALARLEAHPKAAAVCGALREARQTVWYRAMQIDWECPEGPVDFCGGAALFRAEAFRAAGGFPEDVAYGEEPLLCWRLRNLHDREIHHLPRPMADHDLAFQGFGDYWRRTARVGSTFAEIVPRCRDTADPLWSDKINTNFRWTGIYGMSAVWMLAAPGGWRWLPVALLGLVLLRKAWQFRARGWDVALAYAVHTYFAKIPTTWGIIQWRRQARRERADA
jgi:glycosyltransferase involved in cell wall biosynthesis